MENTLVNPSKKQWIALVFCVIAGCYGPMFQYCHGTLADYIMGEYGLSYTQWGTINSVYSFACGFGLFIVGAFVEKLGCKKWTVLGMALMILGHAVFFFAPNYTVLLLARVVSGFGNACIYNAAYTLAVHWFQGTNKMGVATGSMTAADGIGTFFALYIFSIIINAMGMVTGNIAVIIIACVILAVLIFTLKDPGEAENENVEITSAADEGKIEKAWNRNTIAHALIVTGVLGGLGVANYWGPTMLMDMGVSNSVSGLFSTLYTAVGIFSGLIFGAVSDKMGKRKPSLLFAGIGMVLGYIVMILGSLWSSAILFTIAFMLTGFCAYVAYPIGFALISDTVKASKIGEANGIIQGVSFLIGMFVFQQVVGILKDLTGLYWGGLAFCAVLVFIVNVLAVIIFAKEKNEVIASNSKK